MEVILRKGECQSKRIKFNKYCLSLVHDGIGVQIIARIKIGTGARIEIGIAARIKSE